MLTRYIVEELVMSFFAKAQEPPRGQRHATGIAKQRPCAMHASGALDHGEIPTLLNKRCVR